MSNGDTNNTSAKNDIVMSTEQMRQQASNWSLAGDSALRKYLERFAQNLENKSVQLQQSLTQLERRIDTTNTSLGIFSLKGYTIYILDTY